MLKIEMTHNQAICIYTILKEANEKLANFMEEEELPIDDDMYCLMEVLLECVCDYMEMCLYSLDNEKEICFGCMQRRLQRGASAIQCFLDTSTVSTDYFIFLESVHASLEEILVHVSPLVNYREDGRGCERVINPLLLTDKN